MPRASSRTAEKPPSRESPARGRRADAPAPVRLPEGDPLVDRLAAWRRETALASRIPAYRVLPNAALLALARERPVTVGGLLEVKGIGPARVEAYGLALLALLREAPGSG